MEWFQRSRARARMGLHRSEGTQRTLPTKSRGCGDVDGPLGASSPTRTRTTCGSRIRLRTRLRRCTRRFRSVCLDDSWSCSPLRWNVFFLVITCGGWGIGQLDDLIAEFAGQDHAVELNGRNLPTVDRPADLDRRGFLAGTLEERLARFRTERDACQSCLQLGRLLLFYDHLFLRDRWWGHATGTEEGSRENLRHHRVDIGRHMYCDLDLFICGCRAR